MSDVLNTDSDSEYFSLSSSATAFSDAEDDMPSLEERLKVAFSSLSKNFNVVHINAQSLASHYNDLVTSFTSKNIHAVLISETWLKPSLPSTQYPLPGFRLIRNDRAYTIGSQGGRMRMVGGGGVAIYLRCDIDCEIVAQSVTSADSPEYLFLEVTLHHTRALLGVFYSPHLRVDYFEQLESVLADLRTRYEHIILMGDFNTCLVKRDCRSRKLLSLFHSLFLNCLELYPTHFPHNGQPSLLDLIITSSPELVDSHGQFNAAAFSSHDLIYASFKIRPPKRRHKTLMLRNYAKIDKNALFDDVLNSDWELVFGAEDVNEMVQAFNSIILTIFDKHAPLQVVRVKHFPAPWLTPDIKEVMERRNRARIRLRKNPTKINNEAYIELRNRCNKLCRSARRKHIHSTIEGCPHTKMWKYLKSLGIGKADHCLSLQCRS
ncbi:uncharacterized protein LOC113234040 [Hyposmocoma kahamanoa]|uniref:uncharacterized protein LOC113234040 n=1 Tax=Hyposmocoma kahamanoa TaxID=1477025 RepID=UPI000E6D7374|nr:uncharacterized protein LOC113234040 [Hyposmocoma kahamanoa]